MWWLGYTCRRDTQHSAALGLFDSQPDAEVVWAPWQRVEVLNDSASKLDALQTLRVAVHPQEPPQPAYNFDYCSAETGAGHIPKLSRDATENAPSAVGLPGQGWRLGDR